MKVCSRCGAEKELSDFYKLSTSADGKTSACKQCILEARRQYVQDNLEKIRKSCNEYNARHRISRRAYSERYRKENKDKLKELQQKYHAENKEEIAAKRKAYYNKNREKLLKQKKEYIKTHKNEIALKNKRWRKENKDKIKAKKREYYLKHKEDIKAKARKYRSENKLKLKEYAKKNRKRKNEYRNKKRREDINFKLASILRDRVRIALKGRVKPGSPVRDLGCTVAELKAYLESQFKPGMSWENHGTFGWHIDHIKPLSSFDLTNRMQFLEACNYTNLQPLWAEDNLKKSNKLNG